MLSEMASYKGGFASEGHTARRLLLTLWRGIPQDISTQPVSSYSVVPSCFPHPYSHIRLGFLLLYGCRLVIKLPREVSVRLTAFPSVFLSLKENCHRSVNPSVCNILINCENTGLYNYSVICLRQGIDSIRTPVYWNNIAIPVPCREKKKKKLRKRTLYWGWDVGCKRRELTQIYILSH